MSYVPNRCPDCGADVECRHMVGNTTPLVQWQCFMCKVMQPIDHEGIFCARCKEMACCSCERDFKTHECIEKAWDVSDVHDVDDVDDGRFAYCSCGESFETFDALKAHAEEMGGLLHGDEEA